MGIQFSRKISHWNKTLRPGTYWLKRGSVGIVPARSANLVRSIVNFAKFNGMAFIPADTVKKLNDDPHFKYCFSGLITAHTSYYEALPFDSIKEKQQRFLILLKNPALANDGDLRQGLIDYMNNFPLYMPKGSMCDYYKTLLAEDPETASAFSISFNKIDAIEKVLDKHGLKGTADHPGKSYHSKIFDNASDKKSEYLKLCLRIFNILMEEYGFSWHELWR